MANTKIPVELSSTPGIVDNSNATAITIDSSENVGIGTSSPAYKLEVESSSDADLIQIQSTAGANNTVLRLGISGDVATLNASGGSSGALAIKTYGSERMRIDSSGNVGIGDSSPAAKLEIKQGSGNWYEGIRINRSSNTTQFGTFSNNSGATFIGAADSAGGNNNAIIFGNSTNGTTFTERMRIESDGNVGIGTSSPDANLEVRTTQSMVFTSDTVNSITLGISGTNKPCIKFDTADTTNTNRVWAIENGAGDRLNFFRNGLDVLKLNQDGSVEIPGNIGIGTSSPSADGLHIFNSTQPNLFMGTTTNNVGFSIVYNDTDTSISNHSNTPIRIKTNNTERMRIDSSGNLNIGVTSSIGASTNTADGFTFASNYAWLSVSDTGGIYVQRQNDNNLFSFYRAATNVGSISVTSSATTYNTSSDARLKDITGEARGLEVINELNPVAYNWKADGKADEGLIAQEVMDIVPNAVTGSEEDYYQMDYSKLVVHLVKAVKEQQAQIEALQSEINELKNS